MEKRTHKRVRRRGWVALFVATALVVVCLGYFYYTHETQRVRLQNYDEIASIAELKTKSIQEWRKERLDDAKSFSTGHFWRRAVNEWFHEPNKDGFLTGLRDQLLVEQTQGRYSDILLLTSDGNMIVSASGKPDSINAIEKKAIEEAVASGSPVLSDMYRTSHGAILMDSVAPVLDPNGRSIAVAV